MTIRANCRPDKPTIKGTLRPTRRKFGLLGAIAVMSCLEATCMGAVLTLSCVDIGGGSVPNGARNSLARIPLRWMIRECFIVNTGIQFHREAFKEIGLDPSTLYPFVVPRPPPLVATESVVAKLRESIHAAEATDGTLTDEVQASPNAACSFKTEESEELGDAVCRLYDQLKLSKSWWILEIIPLRLRAQIRHDAVWVPYWRYVSSVAVLLRRLL